MLPRRGARTPYRRVVEELEGLPVLHAADQAAWRDWLVEHAQERGVWLVLAKKGSGVAGPTYAEAVDEALCSGWVDGKALRRDAQTYLQRFTPRRPRSAWSEVNVGKVARLAADGRMRPDGLAAVEAARADGRWERAYAPPSTMPVPDDLQAALDADPAAAAGFAALDSRNRYSVLHRLQAARRPETRAQRLETYVAVLARGERLYP